MSGLFQRLLWRLSPPAEVTSTRGYIREFLRRVSPTYPLPRQLERRAISMTRDAGRVVRLVRDEHQPPERVALDMLSTTIGELVGSGRYHIDRGMLSGEGHALTSAFDRCMTELEQRGYQTEGQAWEAMRRLREQIRAMG